jgi:hypothetical protein
MIPLRKAVILSAALFSAFVPLHRQQHYISELKKYIWHGGCLNFTSRNILLLPLGSWSLKCQYKVLSFLCLRQIDRHTQIHIILCLCRKYGNIDPSSHDLQAQKYIWFTLIPLQDMIKLPGLMSNFSAWPPSTTSSTLQ